MYSSNLYLSLLCDIWKKIFFQYLVLLNEHIFICCIHFAQALEDTELQMQFKKKTTKILLFYKLYLFRWIGTVQNKLLPDTVNYSNYVHLWNLLSNYLLSPDSE